jgi:alpha-L-fucosidase
MTLMIYARSFGGNYLLNIGPAPDGTMRKGYYTECEKLAAWMKINKESVIGTQAIPAWKELCSLPMTRNKENYYVHLLPEHPGSVTVKNLPMPSGVVLLDGNKNLDFKFSKKDGIQISVPAEVKNFSVIKLCY